MTSTLTEDLGALLTDLAEYPCQEFPEARASGLFTGAGGIALFYYEMYRYTNDEKYYDQAVNYFEAAYNSIIPGKFGFSHGASGVMWLMDYFCREEVFSSEFSDHLNLYDEILLAKFEDYKDNIDPMHGLLSVANYLLNRGTAAARVCLQKIVHAIEEKKLPQLAGVGWVCTEDDPVSGLIWHINLGYAHGIPAILYFLGKLIEAGICVDECRELRRSGLDYLLSCRHSDQRVYFPFRVERAGVKWNYRMAFCNGDLGMAMGLTLIGQQMADEGLQSIAREVSLNAARIALEDIGYQADIGLCHGAAGNGYIFMKLFDTYKSDILQQACLAEYSRLLLLREEGKGIAGLRAIDHDKERGEFFRRANPGFIEGTAGVGLSILSLLRGGGKNEWDRILYLS